MKKWLLICSTLALIIILSLIVYSNNKTAVPKEKYSINGHVSFGAVDNENTDKTRIEYSIVISGSKNDINNIDTQEPLINMEYYDLMLENGPHNIKNKNIEDNNSYLEISGSFVFDTSNRSKKEIDEMNLFQGIKIYDYAGKEYVLTFKNNSAK